MLGFGEVNGSKIHFVKLKIDRLLRGKLDLRGKKTERLDGRWFPPRFTEGLLQIALIVKNQIYSTTRKLMTFC